MPPSIYPDASPQGACSHSFHGLEILDFWHSEPDQARFWRSADRALREYVAVPLDLN
jgi:hypothetical protein